MDKLADCKRAIRIALIHCIAFWIALADKSRFLRDDACRQESKPSALSTPNSTAICAASRLLPRAARDCEEGAFEAV
jgi:hypothetical protein